MISNVALNDCRSNWHGVDMGAMPPIFVARLFRELHSRFMDLLRSLDADDWHHPLVSSQRTVKDIVSHLLDRALRRLSVQRDSYFIQGGSSCPREDDWELATRRLSPYVLIELHEWSGPRLCDLFESLRPLERCLFPVARAGEQELPNWFGIAREYSKKWHCMQRIFDAVGKPSTIVGQWLLRPYFDTFMRALPWAFRDVVAAIGDTVAVRITGDAGGIWQIVRIADGWWQMPAPVDQSTATVTMSRDIARRLFTECREIETIRSEFPEIKIEGDAALGASALEIVSMMAVSQSFAPGEFAALTRSRSCGHRMSWNEDGGW